MIPVVVIDLRMIPRTGIVGVFQRQKLGGRVSLQIEAAVQQAVRQRAVLLVGKADGALAVPIGGVVVFGGKAGAAG